MRVDILLVFLSSLVLVSGHIKHRAPLQYGLYQSPLYAPGGSFVNAGKCGRRLTARSCPLFNLRSDFVSKEDFIVKVMSQENGWITLLSKEINSPSRYGKCRLRYNNPESNGELLRPDVCYNLDKGICEFFIDKVKLTEDECGRALLTGVNLTLTETFYSQNLDRYFLRDVCYGGKGDNCPDGRYIELIVNANRFLNTVDRAAEITGLPWDQIAADFRNVFGEDLINPDIRHAFLGEECEFPY